MEPENHTKENKNTLTNILLFLVLLVMVGILFFLVKNYKFSQQTISPEQNSEVYTNEQIVNYLEIGKKYNLRKSVNPSEENNWVVEICKYNNKEYGKWIFAFVNQGESCDKDVDYDLFYIPELFEATAKTGVTREMIDELNIKYNVRIDQYYADVKYKFIIEDSNLDSLKALEIYFDTGLFSSVTAGFDRIYFDNV